MTINQETSSKLVPAESLAELICQADGLKLIDPPRGLNLAKRAILLAQRTGDQNALAGALEVAGTNSFHIGDYRQAIEYLGAGTELFTTLKNIEKQVVCLTWQGNSYAVLLDQACALDCYARTLDLLRVTGDQESIVILMNNVALLHANAGRETEALAAYYEAIPLARELENVDNWHILVANIAFLKARMGRRETQREQCLEAIALVNEILPAIREIHHHIREAQCLSTLGEAHQGMGDYTTALEYYAEALVVSEQIDDRRRAAMLLGLIGEAYLDQGRLELAITQLSKAIEAITALGLVNEEARVTQRLASAYEGTGRYLQALDHFKRYHLLTLAQQQVASENKTETFITQLKIDHAQREAEIHRERASELATLNQQLQEQAVQLRRQAVQLERYANADGMTGLANRRFLDCALEEQFRESRSTKSSFTIAIADIDHFKQINDQYSHLIGDEVIKTVARIFVEQGHPDSLIARYGGEEFVILLPGFTAEMASEHCKHLCNVIAAFDWAALHEGLQVTISLGYSNDAAADTATALLQGADTELYRAKQAGRNRVSPATSTSRQSN